MIRREQRVPAEQIGFFSSLVYPDYRRLWGATASGILFVVIMLSSLLLVHLRAIYARGLATGALAG